MDRRRIMSAGIMALGTGGFGAMQAQAAGTGLSLIEKFAATLSSHDIDGFAALFSDDYRNHQLSAAAPPPLVGMSQKQATVAFFAARLAGIPDLRVSIEVVVESDGKVAASFVYAGTHGGTYFGVAPTGKPLRFTSCDIYAIRDNVFVEHWGMGDIAGTLAQLKS